MDRNVEIALIDELLGLKSAGRAFLDEAVAESPIEHYVSNEHFTLENERIFKRLPHAIAHVSELPENGSFVRRDVAGSSVLVTRDKDGVVRAFHNVCRHRGTQLVSEESGCKHRFSCPYHAWTYSSAGDLIAAPIFLRGFQKLKKLISV